MEPMESSTDQSPDAPDRGAVPSPGSADAGAWPAVSVVMPVRNEERHLATSVAGVVNQHYRGEWELILSVGPSNDRTRQIADGLAADDPRIVVIDNPSGYTPDALNLGIRASRHGYVIRVDGHGEMAPGYLDAAVSTLQRTGAANVGGLMHAQGSTPFEEAVAAAYNSRLGLGGGAFHLAHTPEGPAESVFLGAFRKDALEQVHGYDPTMLRAQDWELNLRLREAGQQVWFTPDLRVTYRPRSTVKALANQFFRTGKWRREVIRRYPRTASIRYLAPPVATAAIAGGSLLGLAGLLTGRRPALLGWLVPAAYLAAVLAGVRTLRTQLSPAARLRLPLVLAVMHLCWGAGYLVGLREDDRHGGEHAPRP